MGLLSEVFNCDASHVLSVCLDINYIRLIYWPGPNTKHFASAGSQPTSALEVEHHPAVGFLVDKPTLALFLNSTAPSGLLCPLLASLLSSGY